MKVRCNWCMTIQDEDELILDSAEEEVCSNCKKPGHLMDFEEEEEE